MTKSLYLPRFTSHLGRCARGLSLLAVGLLASSVVACDELPAQLTTVSTSTPVPQPTGDGGDDGEGGGNTDGGGGNSNSSTTAGDDDPTDNDETSGDGEDNTFDHDADLSDGGGKDPFEILAEQQAEGPPEVRARLHSCRKLRVVALRRLLVTFGVDLDATGDPQPAGQLYTEGIDAMGAANYAARQPEARSWTNSGATKMQDILVQAAPEIIAALPTVEHCQTDTGGVEMFDESDQCNEQAISCLIGKPASTDHVAICNHTVANASDPETGKQIAVAALLAAAHTCE